jgi:hypothetical protein
MTGIKILFITHPYPNYVPDLLLHGLRKILGPDLVDFPRKDCVYAGILGLGICPENQKCPNRFPSDRDIIDREDIPQKIVNGVFKYVICDIRAVSVLQNIVSKLPPGLVLIDGEDHPAKIPQGPYVVCRRETDGTDRSIPLPMALPEEIYNWIRNFDTVEKTYSIGFLGSVGQLDGKRKSFIDAVAKYYPDTLLSTTAVPSDDNPYPAVRFGRNDYYLNLQKCKIVLNLKGAGYDTFRFWENSACNAVHVSQKLPLFIPDDFEDGRQILRFDSVPELRKKIDEVLENKIDTPGIITEGRDHLKKYHFTEGRANYLIRTLARIFG